MILSPTSPSCRSVATESARIHLEYFRSIFSRTMTFAWSSSAILWIRPIRKPESLTGIPFWIPVPGKRLEAEVIFVSEQVGFGADVEDRGDDRRERPDDEHADDRLQVLEPGILLHVHANRPFVRCTTVPGSSPAIDPGREARKIVVLPGFSRWNANAARRRVSFSSSWRSLVSRS